MKKLLSLMLVAVMLLATLLLTSCDLTALLGTESTTTTTTTTEPPKNVRTTVTEMEWRKAFDVTNYTLVQKVEYEDETMSLSIIANGNLAWVDYLGVMKLYVELEDGIIVVESDDEYYGLTAGDQLFGEDTDLSLSGIGLIPEIENFSDLVYDEDAKVYTYKNNSMLAEFAFEDGKLASIKAIPVDTEIKGSIEVTNIGTTELELPKYVDLGDGVVEPSKAGKDVVTTVTEEQFNAALNITNFTMTTNALVQKVTIKYTETAYSETNSSIGYDNTDYRAIIDGVWYDIGEEYNYQTGEYSYVATESYSQDIDNALSNMLETLAYADLTYNTEGRYYEGEAEGAKFYLYFENGNIVQMIAFTNMGNVSMEVMASISDIGTTKVDLPEYTVYVDSNKFTEEQWNEIMASQNFTATVEMDSWTYDEEYGYTDYSSNVICGMTENGYITMDIDNPENVYCVAFDNGAVYELMYVEDTDCYLGGKIDGMTPDMCTLGTMVDTGLSYSDFYYYKDLGEYYYYSNNGEETVSCTIIFEDGQIVSMNYSKYSADGNYDYRFEATFSNVGTTEVNIPEFTVAE